MHNIRLADIRLCELRSEDYESEITKFAVDSLTPLYFFCSKSDVAIYNSDFCQIHRFDLEVDSQSDVVTFDYLSDQLLLCYTTSNGAICTFEPISHLHDTVGCVSDGISGGAWSPDLGLLVLVSSANSVLLLTAEFDVVLEFNLHNQGIGQDQLVTVGWGTKETQFQGSAGKQAAFAKPEEPTPTHEWDDRRVRVVWRGDGMYFAVSSVCPDTGCRSIGVWTREGVHSTNCEPATGLEQSLAWKPSGSVLATSAHRQNEHQVIFYERNGQRHYEFSLRFEQQERKVVELCWNLDSSILAVWSSALQQNDATHDRVQLWTCNNYHWYLKYTYKADRLAALQWDLEQSSVLHLVTKTQKYIRLTFTSCVYVHCSDPLATVAVVDGKQLLLTCFAKCVVPPPMSQWQTQVSSCINQVALGPEAQLAILLEDSKTIAFAQIQDDGVSEWQYVCPIDTSSSIIGFNLTWFSKNSVAIIFNRLGNAVVTFLEIDFKSATWSESCQFVLDFNLISIRKHPTEDLLLLQNARGAWHQLSKSGARKNWNAADGKQVVFCSPCNRVECLAVENNTLLIGLSDRYQLFVNNQQLANNVNSFTANDKFLLVTSLSHQMFCITLENLLGSDKKLPSSRSVERGSSLICAVPGATRVVLQMPRGNLESIHPRPLVLAVLKTLIDTKRYKSAIVLMKRHRINMNLLFDHNPKLFLENVSTFVEQIHDPLLLNLFVIELDAEDSVKSMYSDMYVDCERLGKYENKVGVVCTKVREVLDSNTDLCDQCFTVVLSTYVKCPEPQIDGALLRVKSLLDRLDSAALVDKSLRHLLYLVDAETLYKMALATFDFDLVLMVAERSHKDPKEYIPFLNDLRRLQPTYMKFKIEMLLERPAKGLMHLSRSEDAEHIRECLEVVKKHKLYARALEIFESSPKTYKLVCQCYAEYLSSKRNLQQSALFYLKADNLQAALDTYTVDLDWKRVVWICERLDKSQSDVHDILQEIAQKLRDRKLFGEAAALLEQQLQDWRQAAIAHCEGGDFQSASLLLEKHGEKDDQWKTTVLPHVTERVDNMVHLIDEFCTNLSKHCARLHVLRKEKLKRLQDWIESGEPDSIQAEVYSQASTTISTLSQSSSKTARSALARKERRRLHDKKKLSTREGGRYEDLALLDAIKQTVTQTDHMREEISQVLLWLAEFDLFDDARSLQSNYDRLLNQCSKLLPQIWPNKWTAEMFPGPLDELFKDESGIVQMPVDGLMPPSVEIEPQMRAPVLRCLEWKLDFL